MPETYIIGDIHGCSQTLKALLGELSPGKKDTLVFLGDYIDRGPDSAGAIDEILLLQQKGYSIIALRGNHEENMLKALREYDLPTFTHYARRISKSGNLLNKEGRLQPRYLDFFNALPYHFAIGDILCVHAGINNSISKPLTDTTSLLEQRHAPDQAQLQKLGFRHLVHGHVPTNLQEIENAIDTRHYNIPLDNGCIYTKPHKVYDYKQLGHLCCLAVNRWELVKVGNVDL